MAGLTRRAFLASTTAIAGAVALPTDMLGRALAAPVKPSDAPTTLQQTIGMGSKVNNKFRHLVVGPGEAYVARPDITGKAPDAARAKNRRSLAYLGHFSDIHIIDAQTPGRLEPLIAVTETFIDASRPQDTMTTNVLAQMVATMRKSAFSPLTGAPMAAAVNTGDSADSRAGTELQWYLTCLDGGKLTPNTGKADVYEGVQAWEDATYVYQPSMPELSKYGPYGFPTLPTMLNKAVSQTVISEGLPCPWYATYGNHDTLFMGNIQVEDGLEAWAMGGRKASQWPAATSQMVNWWAQNTSAFQQMVSRIGSAVGVSDGTYSVTADPRRKQFDQIGFMQAHLDSPATPGPVGHGFTQENVDQSKTYWQKDITPYLRIFGLDTCNQVTGADGAVPQDQYDWLEAGLKQAAQENVLCMILSHHNSYTLENIASPAIGPSQNLIHAEEFVTMLHQYPHMIAWLNGHTHMNTITAQPNPNTPGAGFWEITTASCVDYPQQQQLVEVVDNRDGTLSIFTTALDHDSDAAWKEDDYSQKGFASLSRLLAANSWAFYPQTKTGSELDRNTELLLDAPFELSKITDSAIEQEHNKQKATIIANSKGQSQ